MDDPKADVTVVDFEDAEAPIFQEFSTAFNKPPVSY
jgi:hypothetical protein